jgi:hypothetical protein
VGRGCVYLLVRVHVVRRLRLPLSGKALSELWRGIGAASCARTRRGGGRLGAERAGLQPGLYVVAETAGSVARAISPGEEPAWAITVPSGFQMVERPAVAL